MSSPTSPLSPSSLGPPRFSYGGSMVNTKVSLGSWQSKLMDFCREQGLSAPVFNVISDRRGGRTAWSSTLTLAGLSVSARFWYDGDYVNNAKEDAAEVALKTLLGIRRAATI